MIARPGSDFKVFKTTTDLRHEAQGEFIACLNANVRVVLGGGDWAVVEHAVSLDEGHQRRDLKVIVRVVIDNSLEDDEIRADQTCRNAIGIPYEYDEEYVRVGIRPLHVSRRQRTRMLVARALGRRYVILRVQKGDIPDMEKRLARMAEGLFPVVGVPTGGRVVVEAIREVDGQLTMTSLRVRALVLGDDAMERIRCKQEPISTARFVDAQELLGISPDIGELFLDLNERETIGVRALDPVRVRRDLRDLFGRELLGAGIVFFLSLFGVSSALPWDGGWLKFTIVAISALLLTLGILLVNLRAQAN